MKWMMGWMHDTLDYFAKDPIYRRHHQNDITFSLTYAFTENFMLPLSHDEVVYGKQSILNKQPGDEWRRFANLRLLYGYMFMHPGAKLLFMGDEFGQYKEWNFEKSLDWNLLEFEPHKGVKDFMSDLNQFYKSTPALYEKAFSSEGFEWISYEDNENSVLSFIRKGHDVKNNVIVVCNFTPNLLRKYRIGVPKSGKLIEVFNSDHQKFGGAGNSNNKALTAKKSAWNNQKYSVEIDVPPLAIAVFKYK
jgi:1,4-alpha-glucan branching enzyme